MRKPSRNPDPPCNHYDNLIGTISAGDDINGPFCSVATCHDCITKSAGYVQMVTGMPHQPLITYEQAQREAARKFAGKFGQAKHSPQL
jgi:hypothetical protein